jgi:hypothetical protein
VQHREIGQRVRADDVEVDLAAVGEVATPWLCRPTTCAFVRRCLSSVNTTAEPPPLPSRTLATCGVTVAATVLTTRE